jgi:hypothetical protein
VREEEKKVGGSNLRLKICCAEEASLFYVRKGLENAEFRR